MAIKLIRVQAGLYRSESGHVRVVDRVWEGKPKAERWLVEWQTMSMPGIMEKRARRFPTFGAAKTFVNELS